MIRLGVAVRILGVGGLRARDGRRAEHAPHLSVSLLLVREVLLQLALLSVAALYYRKIVGNSAELSPAQVQSPAGSLP